MVVELILRCSLACSLNIWTEERKAFRNSRGEKKGYASESQAVRVKENMKRLIRGRDGRRQ